MKSSAQKVRETLSSRPAGVLRELSEEVRYTFIGLFAGSRQTGTITPIGLKIGKYEAEEHWPEAWEALQKKGLIGFKVFSVKMARGGTIEKVTWWPTELGMKVRRDDIDFYNEFCDAWAKDLRGE